ncbi:MAG TPA: hypothetical protein VHZ95_15670, partial [Polyangiales bacterium]|nr:hypothetical protein [Polyangiales bacterium]
LGSKRAQLIHDGVLYYAEHDAERVAEGQRAARGRQEAAHQAELADKERAANEAASETDKSEPRNQDIG